MAFFETAHSLLGDADMIRRRFHGVIEVAGGSLQRIRMRPWPSMISQLRVWRDMLLRPAGLPGDTCLLYYDQLVSMPNFLVLKYVVSTPGASFRTFRIATVVLDEIARIKRSDAIVCEASNTRISERLLERWGWERHVPQSRRRHYIKRFYGTFPETCLTPGIPEPVSSAPVLSVPLSTETTQTTTPVG